MQPADLAVSLEVSEKGYVRLCVSVATGAVPVSSAAAPSPGAEEQEQEQDAMDAASDLMAEELCPSLAPALETVLEDSLGEGLGEGEALALPERVPVTPAAQERKAPDLEAHEVAVQVQAVSKGACKAEAKAAPATRRPASASVTGSAAIKTNKPAAAAKPGDVRRSMELGTCHSSPALPLGSAPHVPSYLRPTAAHSARTAAVQQGLSGEASATSLAATTMLPQASLAGEKKKKRGLFARLGSTLMAPTAAFVARMTGKADPTLKGGAPQAAAAAAAQAGHVCACVWGGGDEESSHMYVCMAHAAGQLRPHRLLCERPCGGLCMHSLTPFLTCPPLAPCPPFAPQIQWCCRSPARC